MRTIQTSVFTYDELSEEAKARARDWFREASAGDWAWSDESRQSIETFCDRFGLDLKTWEVDAWSYDFTVKIENHHVRGLKLRDFDREHMPTGYCLDCALWATFFDEFKRTGDAKHAIDAALHAGFKEWRDDLQFQQSDEGVEETIEANEYEFTEEGKAL